MSEVEKHSEARSIKQVKMSVSSLVGMIIAIIALLLSAIPIINNFAAILGVASLILGIVGLVKTKGGKRSGKGFAITALILSVIALVIVVASQAIYSAALDSASKGFNKSMDKMSGSATADVLGKDVDVTLGTFSATTDQYGLAVTVLPVKVTNRLSEAKSYYIKIEAVDASGSRIAEDTVSVDKLGAKQSQQLEAFKFIESTKLEAVKTATFKIASVSEL